jgi:TPR repeat protein
MRLSALAEQGQADAQNALAARMAQGYFLKQDLRGAVYWYAQAVKRGYTHSMWNLGTMLIVGEGVDTPAVDLGMKLIRRAAESGDTSACLFMSQLFVSGRYGYSIDPVEAKNWRDRAFGRVEFIEYSDGIDIGALGIQLIKPNLPEVY